MDASAWRGVVKAQGRLRRALTRTEVLALFPLLAFSAHALGGPDAVLAAAVLLPALLVLAHAGLPATAQIREALPEQRPGRGTMAMMLDRIAGMPDADSACVMLAIDDWAELETRAGQDAARGIADRCADRLRGALRHEDLLADLGEGRFGVVLSPIPDARLGLREALADRLRAAIAEPFALDGATIRLTASAGHAALTREGRELDGGADRPGEATLAGAEAALEEARTAGPDAVRAFAPWPRDMAICRSTDPSPPAEEVADALASGEILPWFQPQVDAATGAVTGFEALARWQHPELGLLAPNRFLDAVAEAGRIEALGHAMRRGALEALARWDAAGAPGLTVSVNAAVEELRSPTFAEQVAWDLDLHDTAPERLIVEVLETVAASTQDDSIVTTLAAMRGQGIGIDLDDFGVGQASLLSIRRFGVRRIKIDRSFVLGVDVDDGQRSMVGAIVSLAREMGLSTLAEGVETDSQREALRDLGCAYLQGFAIGRPMPLSDTLDWLAAGRQPMLDGQDRAALRPAQ
jgi:EAL domain-containing protein (putative c-di-GMP-specific phosphodiesterase class I)/GGDEF domain-containing protein